VTLKGGDVGGGTAHDFRLGDWLVQPSLCRISRGENTVHLRPKVMDVLACLAAKAGTVVSPQALIDAVWARKFISDTALSRAIFELRRAIGDDGAQPHYVETIAKRGYRLVAPVEPAGETATGTGSTSRFIVVIGDHEIRLCEGENIVGRGPEARVRLDSSAVSRAHARIVVNEARATIEDLRSKNGTEIDGQRIVEPVALGDRALIRIGTVTLVFRTLPPEGSTRTSPSR
jgi:DNA-binding winged helix-turn-helix (wHTH) protein